MPGLVLTVAQTARLYALSRTHATRMLDALEADGFLVHGPNGGYRRAMPPTCD